MKTNRIIMIIAIVTMVTLVNFVISSYGTNDVVEICDVIITRPNKPAVQLTNTKCFFQNDVILVEPK